MFKMISTKQNGCTKSSPNLINITASLFLDIKAINQFTILERLVNTGSKM